MPAHLCRQSLRVGGEAGLRQHSLQGRADRRDVGRYGRPAGGRDLSRVLGLIGEERHADDRPAGGERAQRGAGAAVADDGRGMGQHVALRYPALDPHIRRRGRQRVEVDVAADREQAATGSSATGSIAVASTGIACRNDPATLPKVTYLGKQGLPRWGFRRSSATILLRVTFAGLLASS